jgi:hypothetical protein
MEFLDFYYKIMNQQKAPYDKLATTRLSADYVARETRRALAGVAGEVRIYPGIDSGVPTVLKGNAPEKHTSPEDVHNSIRAAFGAGADGVILSREYAEMWLANLASAGNTLREILSRSNA